MGILYVPSHGPSTLERAVGEERSARKWTTTNEWRLGVQVTSTHRQEIGQSTTAKLNAVAPQRSVDMNHTDRAP
jgi:hypothetical protein